MASGEAKGETRKSGAGRAARARVRGRLVADGYCFSHTKVPLTSLPFLSVAFPVPLTTFPSLETTYVPAKIAFPAFFQVTSVVFRSMRLRAIVSASPGTPVPETG